MVKAATTALLVAALAAMATPCGRAEEKTKSEGISTEMRPTTPVKVAVTFAEFEGEKKVKSLP